MQRDAQRGNSGCGDDAGFLLLRATRERKAMPSQKRFYACRSPPYLLGAGCYRIAVPSEDAIAWPGSTEVRVAATPDKRRSLARRRCYSWWVTTVVTHLKLRGSCCNLRLLLTLIGGLKVKAGTGGVDLADKNWGEIPICHSPSVARDRRYDPMAQTEVQPLALQSHAARQFRVLIRSPRRRGRVASAARRGRAPSRS
jgi:hypothetical protein